MQHGCHATWLPCKTSIAVCILTEMVVFQHIVFCVMTSASQHPARMNGCRQIIKLKDPYTCLVLIECDCSKTTRPNTSFFHPPLPWFFPFSSIFHHLVKKKLHQLFAYFNAINSFNPFTPKSDLIDFTLSNARRFYSWKGDPLGVKGLQNYLP